MSSFLLRLAGFFGLQAVLAAPVLWLMIRQPSEDGYLQALRRKHERLERLPSPRILFLGGSSTAFGVDSPRVEQGLGLPVVNLGLYAPLGLDFMLNEVRGALRAGDVVVICPEFSLLVQDGNPEVLRRMVAVEPRALEWLEPRQQKSTLDQLHKLLGASAKRALRECFGDPEPALAAQRPYTLDSFNDHGDVVAHHGLRSKDFDRRFQLPGLAEDPRLRRHLELLDRFDRECRAIGAACFCAYPPAVREALEGHQAEFDALELRFERDLRMPKLYPAADAVFPAALFFDSAQHLSYEGKERRTGILIDALRRQLRR